MSADALYSFLVEGTHVRGRIVRLRETWREISQRGRHPEAESRVLGEAMAATALLSAQLKGEGRLTLQVRGQGPLNLLVTQFSAPDGLRGMVQSNAPVPAAALPAVFGPAQLALTLEPPNSRERYQGLVDLVGDHLADAVADYFDRSEQLPSRFWLAVDPAHVAGLMLQRLPGADTDPDAWERCLQLASTVEPAELLGLDPVAVLRRLFAGETLRLFDPQPLRFACGCSRERSQSMLVSLGRTECDEALSEQGAIEVRCEFCNALYLFDQRDVVAMFDGDVLH